jgi:methyl-accepting chemotaxis protein
MSIIFLRSLPDVAKVWLDMGARFWVDSFNSSKPPHPRTTLLHCETWRQRLARVSSQLRDISSSSEGEFLTIGEHLQDFQERAGEITTIISGLVRQLGGEKGMVALRGLADMLDTLQTYLDNTKNLCGQQSLTEILTRLQQVNAPLNSFGQMDKSLKMFSTYTRIESARLGDKAASFDSLARDVTRLSNAVSDKADAVCLRKNELSGVTQNALATLVNMGAEQQAKILSILQKTDQNLESLAGIVHHSTSSAGVIAAAATEVTENLGQVVFSLQAHDTVRQQIQHAAEAIDELAVLLPDSSSLKHPDSGDNGHLLMETGTVCQIQSAQLRHSAAEFLQAVENIIVNLREIAAKETGMADDTRELLGMTDQTGASFFSEMGDDLVEVTGMLTATVATNRELSETMTTAADTVRGIYGFVDDIDTIAYDIKLIALNFLIQSAQLGSKGEGLGVMAESINRLSEDARDQASGIEAILTEVKEFTDCMCHDAISTATAMEAGIKQMRLELEETLAALQEMNEGMAQGLALANAMAQELSVDIDEITVGITVHQKVAAVLNEAESMLDGIGTEATVMATESECLSTTKNLHAAEKRYTMHSERDIHAAVVNAQPLLAMTDQQTMEPALSLEAISPEQPDGAPDLGDNVELF